MAGGVTLLIFPLGNAYIPGLHCLLENHNGSNCSFGQQFLWCKLVFKDGILRALCILKSGKRCT